MNDAPDYAADFLATMRESGIERADLAILLRVSPHTVASWLKPATSTSHRPVPLWAVDLLRLRLGLPQSPASEKADRFLAEWVAELGPW